MKCRSCGEELPERARFCPACGAPVEEVPAPKRLEEPLDPFVPGAVPLVPVAPPPRAYRIEPRASRAAAMRGDRRVARAVPRPVEAAAPVPTGERDVEKDEPVEKNGAPEPVEELREDVVEELAADVPADEPDLAEDVPADETAVIEFAADEAPAEEAEPDQETAFADQGAGAGAFAALVARVRELPGPKPVLLAVALVVVAAVIVVLVGAATSPIGPFAPHDESAPVVQPPSDGSIPPLEGESEEEPPAETDELLPRASVGEYSWEELAQISALIAEATSDEEAREVAAEYHLCLEDGTLDGTQTRELELTDGTTVTVAVAGFRHDDRADGSGAAGVSFVTLGSLGRQAYNPSGEPIAWEDAPLRSWMNQSLMAMLPDGLADLVVPVSKETNTPSGGRCETTDSMWLLSATELTGMANNGDAEGEQYQLFSDRGVDGASSFLALCDDYWWMRGPSSDTQWQGTVTSDGSPHSGRNPIYEFDVVAGFCL